MLDQKPAQSSTPIHELLANRWSSLCLGENALSEETITSLLEAARWSPSSYNEQPWRFVVGRAGSEDHAKLSECLFDGNAWARKAPLLLLIIAKKNLSYNGNPNAHHRYDCGAAGMAIQLQATAMNLATHQMGGFDTVKAQELFGIQDEFEPVVMIAVGPYDAGCALDEKHKEREEAPRSRKSLDELIWS